MSWLAATALAVVVAAIVAVAIVVFRRRSQRPRSRVEEAREKARAPTQPSLKQQGKDE